MANASSYSLQPASSVKFTFYPMKTLLSVFAVALTISTAAYGQAALPAGLVSDLYKRLYALEKKVAQLQRTAGTRKIVDSKGRFVGPVLSETPTNALIQLPFRGGSKKFVIDLYGSPGGPAYSARFFESTDCSGPAYARASRYDGTLEVSIWGDDYLWYSSKAQRYEYPRDGAKSFSISVNSIETSSGYCAPYDVSDTIVAFLETDLVEIFPLAGFSPPFRIVE